MTQPWRWIPLAVLSALPVGAVAAVAPAPTRSAAPTLRSAPPSATAAGSGAILDDLENARVVPTDTASLEGLRSELLLAQDELVAGNVQTATARLVSLVESSRFSAFRADAEYQSAELTLGRALVRGGGYRAAERYLARVMAAGATSPFFTSAYRAMVDVALETHDESAVLARLDEVAASASLPTDSANERRYLAGKADYAAGQFAAAGTQLAEVGRQSRFFAAALYFRALIEARAQHYASARRNLCEIVGPADTNRFAFFIDGRYWAIKDLAYLALGRIAHEQGRYDDAYYFYFRVPEESERLPEALFEASWSMFQKSEYEAARAFIDQFDRSFPASPLGPDARLLRAMIELKSCHFDEVRARLGELVTQYAPLEAEVERLIADPGRRRALYRRLLDRDQIGRAHDPIVELLKLDPRFYRYLGYVTALDREAGGIPQAIAIWDELTAARATGGKASSLVARGAQASEAVQLVADTEALVADSREHPDIKDDAVDLLAAVRAAARPVSLAGPFVAETEHLQALAQQTRRLRVQLVDASSAVAEAALIDLQHRLKSLLRQARLTHIDAVIGKKKRLEIEIANLEQGRYSSEMFGRLETEGLIRDDEEYWPYEGEYWADEYDNYR
jgi:tetratricopeptide (TPR) repeat protein